MTKRVSAKHKIDRRLGENLWGRPKSPLNKREYGPGQHGQRRRGKTSDFGTQLKAKQKLKGYYANITERQFRLIYNEATRLRGDTSENLIGLLERRLDAVVYLEQTAPGQFVRHSLEASSCDHVTCVAGDVFGSGSLDLVTGHFAPGTPAPAITIWRNVGIVR